MAGSALAAGIAAAGARTLVLEAEGSFRDRVRGEAIMPWGVAEARLLGLERVLEHAVANPLTFWDSYQGQDRTGHRDLIRTIRVGEPVMACYHPALQKALLEHAESAGADVWRATRANGVSASEEGTSPSVSAERDGSPIQLTSRLVVGADGRGSPTRGWAGFSITRDLERNLVAGVLVDNVALSDDATHAWLDTEKGHFILNFPQGNGRARVYLCYADGSARRYSGPDDTSIVLGECIASGVDQRQLVLPVGDDYFCRSQGVIIRYRRCRIDYGSASRITEAKTNGRKDATDGGGNDGDERALGPQVAVRPVAVGDQD